MIQYEYRKINPATIMPSSDTVCPRCRHVFSVSSPTSPTLTKPEETSPPILYGATPPQFPNLCNEKSAALHHHHRHNNSDDELEKEIPPTPPPRLKPSNTYANLPPSATITSITSPCPPPPVTKSYVTMSNLNLKPNSNNNNNQILTPTFMPIDSPSRTDAPINNLFSSTNSHSSLSSLTSSSVVCTPSSTTNGGRVYRQLSGGGLIDTSNNNFLRIHETQPMHQMCGGGLINTRPDDDSPFLLRESSSSMSLPLEETTRRDYCDFRQTRSLTSTPSSTASISIYPSSSNISIVVPTSMHTSLEISPNTINIRLPRNPSLPTFPNPSERFQTIRQTPPIVNPTPPIFFPSIIKQTPKPPVDDMQCLTRTVHCLKESGWFHEGLSWNESENLLQGSANGTFIVRESSNPNFLFAITVQTEQEPTSVRIQYDNGCFRLDCVSHVTPIVPQFDCVVDLIEYYVTKHNQDRNLTSKNHIDQYPSGNQVFVDENGYINSVVSLRKPLRSSVPSLMHCARLSINKQLKKRDNYSKSELSQILDQLELPKSLKTYLFQYPYSL